MSRSMSVRMILAGSILASSLIVVGSALAQDALGRGDVLDRNLSTRGRRNEAAPQTDFAGRNLLVTGDVAGGREFRGRVGYAAPGDFRGTLGSDTFTRFRAESAFSSIDYLNYASTTGQLRLGQDLSAVPYRREAYAPPVSGPASERSAMLPPGFANNGIPDVRARQRLDQELAASATSNRLESASDPDIVGVLRSDEGQRYFAGASPLIGMTMTPIELDAQLRGLSIYDHSRLIADRAQGVEVTVGQPFQRSFEELELPQGMVAPDRPEGLTPAEVPGAPDRPEGTPGAVRPRDPDAAYENVLRKVVEHYAERDDVRLDADTALMRKIDEEYARLREQLGAEPPQPNRPLDGETPPTTPDQPTTRPPVKPEIKPGDPASKPGDEFKPEQPLHPPQEDVAKPMTSEDIARLLKHGGQISNLAGDTEDRFTELMRAGEQALRGGDFFTAEKRFNRALRIVPRHPLATAGLANAQLGAGLYASASLSLRALFMDHPAMLDTRYDQELLPSSERLADIVKELRQRIDQREDRAEAGLLITYIGHQTSQRALVQEGLKVIEQVTPTDPLLAVLRAVWLSAEPEK